MTLVISSLGCGGAERVLTTIAGYWAAQGRDVTIVTDSGVESPCYPLHPAVGWQPLATAGLSPTRLHGVAANVTRIRALRRAIVASRPEVVISFMAPMNILTLLATRGLGIPVIVSERVSPGHLPIGAGRESLRRRLYPRAAGVVVQTEGARDFFPEAIRRRTRIIPNAVVVPVVAAVGAGEPTRRDTRTHGRTIIAMGRLTSQKGFDLLLRAFAALQDQHPSWSLTVWGDGPDRSSLESLRDELGLHERATFPGITREPTAEMGRADLFVLSSRFEGFPNALMEAMAVGLSVVSFDCPTGPAEIIRDGVDGLLVPADDVQGLTVALGRLMADDGERARLGGRAVEVASRFSTERVMQLWDDAIESVGVRLAEKRSM